MHPDLSHLAIVTCHFNPAGFAAPLRNFRRFRHALGAELGERLITVELAFREEFRIPDAIPLSGGPQNVLWQKEALLNVGFRRLPRDCECVAWIDADVMFCDADWPQKLLSRLEDVPVVQLFRTMHKLDKDGRVSISRAGVVETMKRGDERGCAGLAWAARREVLEALGGLPDRWVVGGGDRVAAAGFFGLGERSLHFGRCPVLMRTGFQDWGQRAAQEVGGRVGHLPGDVLHLHHGSIENRQYIQRLEILRTHGFDPIRDVRLQENGALEWCSEKPRLHEAVAAYFRSRKEDA